MSCPPVYLTSAPCALSRRRLLQGLAAPAVLAAMPSALAQGKAAPPIIFVHGNGDHAALWMTTLWRFETNDWPIDRLVAFNFADPLSRNDDAVPMPGRSGTADQLRELSSVIRATLVRTGASRLALIGSSRGGYAIRNFLADPEGARQVSHAVLCGTPNQGVFLSDANPGSEFNGRGPFLRRLNAGPSDVVPGTATMTISSDRYDKYAQADGRFMGRPGTATGIDATGAQLRGATNVVLPDFDHREVAFHPWAFREMYRFIAGMEPPRLIVVPDDDVTLDGLVTGNPGGIPTNRPVGDADVRVFRVDPATGQREGEALLRKSTGPDGRWGPLKVGSGDWLEFVLEVPGHPVTHLFRSPFAHSSNVVHLRPARALSEADRQAGAVVQMQRPRGYFGLPRDRISLDGKEPTDVARGVPTDATTTVRLPASEIGRPVEAVFNAERIVVRALPASENRIAIAELTW